MIQHPSVLFPLAQFPYFPLGVVPHGWLRTIFQSRSGTAAVVALIGQTKFSEYFIYLKARGWITSAWPISDAEEVSIWAYTSPDGWYERINGELWDNVVSDEVKGFTPVLNRALSKMFGYAGEVYRGYSDADIEFFLEGYEVGNICDVPAFTSTTKQRDLAFYGNILFIIQSHDGPDVEKFSAIPEEKEILFPAGSRFRVGSG